MGETNPRIRGKNQAEKNASIEQILKSLTRRAVKRAVVYVQPVPLFLQCDIVPQSGIIGKVVIPFSGTLKDLVVALGEMTTSTATITLEVETSRIKHQTHFTLFNRSERLEVEMEIKAGSLLSIHLDAGNIADVLVGIAIYPVIEDHKAKGYLLDEILKDIEEPKDALQDEKE